MVGKLHKCIVCSAEYSTPEAVLNHIKKKHPDWLNTKLFKDYAELVKAGKGKKLEKISDQSSALKQTQDSENTETEDEESTSEANKSQEEKKSGKQPAEDNNEEVKEPQKPKSRRRK